MGRKHAWVERRRVNAFDLMEDRAYLTTELAEILNKDHVHEVRPRQIFCVLKADKRFRKIRKVKVDSVARTKSHEVWLFGRADRDYEDRHPHRAKRGDA
tara:strand:+ start:1021 stop:1317 length:297 start_codon:yes stop_codon:yes gene_type:complete